MSEKINISVFENTEKIYISVTEGIITQISDIMDMITINTGALEANTQKEISHNLGTLYGATDLEYRLYELNGQERFFNEMYPHPADQLNKLFLTVGEDNPSGLLIKIVYKKA